MTVSVRDVNGTPVPGKSVTFTARESPSLKEGPPSVETPRSTLGFFETLFAEKIKDAVNVHNPEALELLELSTSVYKWVKDNPHIISGLMGLGTTAIVSGVLLSCDMSEEAMDTAIAGTTLSASFTLSMWIFQKKEIKGVSRFTKSVVWKSLMTGCVLSLSAAKIGSYVRKLTTAQLESGEESTFETVCNGMLGATTVVALVGFISDLSTPTLNKCLNAIRNLFGGIRNLKMFIKLEAVIREAIEDKGPENLSDELTEFSQKWWRTPCTYVMDVSDEINLLSLTRVIGEDSEDGETPWKELISNTKMGLIRPTYVRLVRHSKNEREKYAAESAFLAECFTQLEKEQLQIIEDNKEELDWIETTSGINPNFYTVDGKKRYDDLSIAKRENDSKISEFEQDLVWIPWSQREELLDNIRRPGTRVELQFETVRDFFERVINALSAFGNKVQEFFETATNLPIIVCGALISVALAGGATWLGITLSKKKSIATIVESAPCDHVESCFDVPTLPSDTTVVGLPQPQPCEGAQASLQEDVQKTKRRRRRKPRNRSLVRDSPSDSTSNGNLESNGGSPADGRSTLRQSGSSNSNGSETVTHGKVGEKSSHSGAESTQTEGGPWRSRKNANQGTSGQRAKRRRDADNDAYSGVAERTHKENKDMERFEDAVAKRDAMFDKMHDLRSGGGTQSYNEYNKLVPEFKSLVDNADDAYKLVQHLFRASKSTKGTGAGKRSWGGKSSRIPDAVDVAAQDHRDAYKEASGHSSSSRSGNASTTNTSESSDDVSQQPTEVNDKWIKANIPCKFFPRCTSKDCQYLHSVEIVKKLLAPEADNSSGSAGTRKTVLFEEQAVATRSDKKKGVLKNPTSRSSASGGDVSEDDKSRRRNKPKQSGKRFVDGEEIKNVKHEQSYAQVLSKVQLQAMSRDKPYFPSNSSIPIYNDKSIHPTKIWGILNKYKKDGKTFFGTSDHVVLTPGCYVVRDGHTIKLPTTGWNIIGSGKPALAERPAVEIQIPNMGTAKTAYMNHGTERAFFVGYDLNNGRELHGHTDMVKTNEEYVTHSMSTHNNYCGSSLYDKDGRLIAIHFGTHGDSTAGNNNLASLVIRTPPKN